MLFLQLKDVKTEEELQFMPQNERGVPSVQGGDHQKPLTFIKTICSGQEGTDGESERKRQC